DLFARDIRRSQALRGKANAIQSMIGASPVQPEIAAAKLHRHFSGGFCLIGTHFSCSRIAGAQVIARQMRLPAKIDAVGKTVAAGGKILVTASGQKRLVANGNGPDGLIRQPDAIARAAEYREAQPAIFAA